MNAWKNRSNNCTPERILIIVENLPVPFDRRVWQEAVALRKEGYEVNIICPKGKGYDKKYEIIEGICIYRHDLPIEAKNAFGYVVEYAYALLGEFFLTIKVFVLRGFDVIHACNPPDLIFLIALFYKILFRKKFVFDHHDIFPEMWVSKGGKKRFIYKILLLLEKATFKTSNISIATNNYYKAIAIERGGKKENEVFIVRSSPSYNEFLSFIPDKPKAELKNGKNFMVGYVGVMAIQDGVDYLLRSIDNIVNKKKRNDILFVLIGKGPEWSSLVKYAGELRLQNSVKFTGWKNRNQLVDILFACDIGVCPEPKNDYNDISTINKILEYMALGKPIVQYDLSEGRYLAGPASLYARPNDEIDFANKILFLLENETIRKKMGDLGKKRFNKEFSWEKSENELREAYRYLFQRDSERKHLE